MLSATQLCYCHTKSQITHCNMLLPGTPALRAAWRWLAIVKAQASRGPHYLMQISRARQYQLHHELLPPICCLRKPWQAFQWFFQALLWILVFRWHEDAEITWERTRIPIMANSQRVSDNIVRCFLILNLKESPLSSPFLSIATWLYSCFAIAHVFLLCHWHAKKMCSCNSSAVATESFITKCAMSIL